MDFVNNIRDATLDAASAIGYAAKGVGEQVSAYTGELSGQMRILGSNVGHGLSVAAGDLGNSVANMTSNIGRSVSSILAKAFNDFVRLVNACETHEEEDMVIQAELGHLKKRFKEKDLRGNELRETLIRMVYCEMLGYEAPFGYLKAIELCSDPNIVNKKAGYITAALCIPPEHEFRFMIVNRLQMDLQSKNYLEVATALIATSELLTADMIPALIHLVYQALQHKESTVLCKAIMLLQRFHQLDPASVTDMGDELRKHLKTYDISVMFACISVLHDFIIADAASFKDLLPFFTELLMKIVGDQFDHAYDFDNLPAPWVQMKVIRILGALGENDQAASESIYVPILNAMRRADRMFPHHLSCAISADCVHTILRIYPNEDLLEEAACVIDRMVHSRDMNLKYLGLNCMADMIQNYAKYVLRLQMVVMKSLENEDVSIRNSTLEILHRMCNSQNVDVIAKRFLAVLANCYDRFQREQLIDRLCDIAERFAPDPSWYINTMMQVFALGGRQVKPAMEANLIKLLSESQGDEAVDRELRCLAVRQLYELVVDPLAPANVLRVAVWIFGEYGHLSTDPTLGQIVELLGEIWKRPALSVETKSYLIGAFMKISSQSQKIPTMASEIVKECMHSHDTELVQQAMEFREMCKSGAKVFLAAIPEKPEAALAVDAELHFLDSYVMQGRLAGMKDYEERNLSDDDEKEEGLKTEAYEAPPEPAAARPPAPEKELKKEDGFIDFSAVKGSFGFMPAQPAQPAQPAVPAVPEVPEVSEPQQGSDLFGEAEAAGDELFAGMDVAPQPEPEPEPSEQALEAAALFSGVGGTPAASKPRREPRRPAVFKPVQPTQPTQPVETPQMETPAETTDMFADMSAPTENLFDVAAPAPVRQPVDMTQCKLSATYKIFLKEPSGPLRVMSDDGRVFLAHYLIYREGSLVICLFLKSNEALREVTLATQYTEGLGVKFVAEPKAAVEGKTLKWEAIAKEEQVTVLGSTNFHKPTPSSALSMSGHIEYKVEGQEEVHALDFEIPFNFVEMVRETPMTATAYFEMWKAYKAEQKVEIHSSLRNTRLFAEKANKLFHVAIVDVNDVSKTILMAGKVAGTSSHCLMEVNMTSTGCTIFFKAPSSVLCRLLADASKMFMEN